MDISDSKIKEQNNEIKRLNESLSLMTTVKNQCIESMQTSIKEAEENYQEKKKKIISKYKEEIQSDRSIIDQQEKEIE